MFKVLPKILVTICCLLIVSASAQKTSECKMPDVSQRMMCFYTAGDLDAAVPLAEELLERAKQARPESDREIATAHFNIALIRKKRLQKYLATDGELSKNEKKRILKQIEDDAEELEDHFEKVIKLHDSKIKQDDLQLADAQYELAWVLLNYPLGSHVELHPRSQKAKNYYEQSLRLRESKLGADHNVTLSTIFALAECHLKRSEFEQSVPLYLRYIETIGAKYGPGQRAVVPALISLADIYVTIGEKDAAEKAVGSIKEITGSNFEMPEANIVLNDRLTSFDKGYLGKTVIYADLSPGQFNMNPRVSNGRLNNGRLEVIRTEKRMVVRIVVNEDGNVIEAISENENDDEIKEAINEVKTWKFRPFDLNGKKHPMYGFVYFIKNILK